MSLLFSTLNSPQLVISTLEVNHVRVTHQTRGGGGVEIELKARKRGAGWVTLWDHALDRDRGFFFFPFKNPAAVVQDAAVDLANKLCVRKDAGAPG